MAGNKIASLFTGRGPTDTDIIKSFENPERVGRDKSGRWTTFKPEGTSGETDIGYGHMLTAAERRSGNIKIAGELYPYKAGLTDAQVDALLAQDSGRARAFVTNTYPDLEPNQTMALTSLVYNVGIGAFEGSKAAKALNAGDMATFNTEAFSEDKGFVKAGGKTLGGLVRRREAEAQLFGAGPARQPPGPDDTLAVQTSPLPGQRNPRPGNIMKMFKAVPAPTIAGLSE